MMRQRKVGRLGLEVAEIGLGCMGMSWGYGPADDAESIATIHRALERGVTFFDTAEVYGPWENEKLLGRALRGRREKAVIATKFGFAITEDGKRTGRDSRPERVKAAAEGSLRRLGVDHIDLFYQHRVDPMVPIEDTVGALADLVKAGKVRFIGLSEAGAQTIRRAHAVHPLSAVQTEYSLWERGVEADVLPTLRQLGIGLVAYGPLGRGFLTGQLKRAEDLPEGDNRRAHPRMQGENYDKNLSIVATLRRFAEAKGITPAQLALAWVLHQGDDIVPIPGTKRRTFLEQNLDAAAVALSPADLAQLSAAVPPGCTAGARFDPAMLAWIDR